MDPFNNWVPDTFVQSCQISLFLFVFTFLIEISTDELTSKMKSVTLFYNYITRLLWTVGKYQTSKCLQITKYFCVGLTKHVCTVEFSGHAN